MIENLGTCYLQLEFNGNKDMCKFYVVPDNISCILGWKDAAKLRIVTINDEKKRTINAVEKAEKAEATRDTVPIYSTQFDMGRFQTDGHKMTKGDLINHPKYSKIFQGISHLPGKIHIQLDKSVEPHIAPPRRFAISIIDELKAELLKMRDKGHIRFIDNKTPTPWVNALVAVRNQMES